MHSKSKNTALSTHKKIMLTERNCGTKPQKMLMGLQRVHIQLYDVIIWHVPSSFITSFYTNRFDPDRPGNLTRIRTACKKRERERMLWPSRPLTLTKKSKISKWTCSTQFFEYIPILGSISSFETQKLCKRLIFKSWLLHKS